MSLRKDKKSDIKVSFVTAVVLRLQKPVYAVKEWVISNWQHRYPIYGILKEYQAVWVYSLTCHQGPEKVLYFASYIVLDKGNTDLQYKQVLNEKENRKQLRNMVKVASV